MNDRSVLTEAATLARAWSRNHCVADEDSAACCDWYHGAWSALRLVGSVSGAQGDQDFFQSAFAEQAKDGDRVLISGAADYAMLDQVLNAYRRVGAEPRVTIVDQCDTPLKINQWYANKRDAGIECFRADVLTFQSELLFDVVTTHSILSFIPELSRKDLYKNWYKLLCKGGRLITSQVVRPNYEGAELRQFNENEIELFVKRVMDDYAGVKELISATKDEIAELARRFAMKKTTYVVRSLGDLKQGLESCGFEVQRIYEPKRSDIGYRSASPDAPSAMVSARIVANTI